MELVTDSKFEVTQVVIQGFPKQIPDEHPNRLPNLVVPGPAFQGKRPNRKTKLIALFTSLAISHCFLVNINRTIYLRSCIFHFPGFAFNATIEQVISYDHRDTHYGNAQVISKILGVDIYRMAGNFGGKILWRIVEKMSFGGINFGG